MLNTLRFFLLTLSFFTTSLCVSQEDLSVDDMVQRYPKFNSLKDLGIRVQNDFDDDSKKIRAIYSWLIQNIKYKKNRAPFAGAKMLVYHSEYSLLYQLRHYELERVEKAFRQKRGVCWDYSLLFEELCTSIDIKAETIIGVAKTGIGNITNEPLYKDHSWNAVQIDNEWHLLDVTWAADMYHRNRALFDHNSIDHYYLTPSQEFIKTHFPEHPKWQLLAKNISIQEFYASPIYFSNYSESGLELSESTSGLIAISKDRRILLDIKKLPKGKKIQYQINQSKKFKRLHLRKVDSDTYMSKIKVEMQSPNTFITLYIDNNPVVSFKIKKTVKGLE